MIKLIRAFDIKLIFLTLLGGLTITGSLVYSPDAVAASCNRTVTADVVALDQPIMFNRLGAQNVNYMVYALKRDVVNKTTKVPITVAPGGAIAGQVELRPDKRPRPLVLRVAAGDCLEVTLTNLLTSTGTTGQANPFQGAVNPNNCNAVLPGTLPGDCDDIMNINNQVEGRFVSFHPLGMQLVNGIADDGSYVGNNASSLLGPGQSNAGNPYKYYAEEENAYMVYSRGQPFGGEASGGNVGVGLFAVVNVEPSSATSTRHTRFYRSQITEEEMRLASMDLVPASATCGTQRKTPMGHPIIDYEAMYPSTNCNAGGTGVDLGAAAWVDEGKAGLPIINMLTAANEIVHSDINAVIVGPGTDGKFDSTTYPLESEGNRNPVLHNRLEPFREYTVVFHDEMAATQAFPLWFEDPVLGHTLHGVRDSFMINYGSGGIGAEIIANRLGVGPMHDCLNCAYEEFFLSAYTVGDPAQLVDVPANAGLELCDPNELVQCLTDGWLGPKATQAYYPEDPSNVHHSYPRDGIKFRQLHAGPKEQHIFHLHNHQWLFNPNDDNSNYIDAQGIGPGSGYTLEINFGGAGNRNISAGDAIFHCHFYPHFAQGMWEMWRINDTMQTGTVLEVSGDGDAPGFHANAFGLQFGKPAVVARDGLTYRSRAYPDGEIVAGTPIPAVVPLPGKAMAPMPGDVVVISEDIDNSDLTGTDDGLGEMGADRSLARVIDRDKNPGYPFWIAGIEHTLGQRPTTPPLDMLADRVVPGPDNDVFDLMGPANAETGPLSGLNLWRNMTKEQAGGHDGGLPRHTLDGVLAGGVAVATQNRLDFTKVVKEAKPVWHPETGTDLEKLVMDFNTINHDSYSLSVETPAATFMAGGFKTNSMPPAPSAPYYEPCRDDDAQLIEAGTLAKFWNSTSGTGGGGFEGTPQFGAKYPRVYQGANIQIDAVLNKAGYHFPQQRIIALWQDVDDIITKGVPPEPLVMRANTFDCVKYLHANLVPEYYELDDYQVRTPTDIIGQHIHLPKWDLVSNDGSGNGWNYEDGTLSPGAVRERIHAINAFNGDHALQAQPHPFFGDGGGDPARPWLGARSTIQRWFTDPVYNVAGEDRGLGIVFTHDHYGPSTHQQVGLYATILAEPAGSTWAHNEKDIELGTRTDGGPTSWQARIEPGNTEDLDDPNNEFASFKPFREFYFEFGDFQHAYEKGVWVGVGPDGVPIGTKDVVTHSPVTGDGTPLGILAVPQAPDGVCTGGVCEGTTIASADTFRFSINPSYRQEPLSDEGVKQTFPDIVRFPPTCPGSVPGAEVPRPCAEAISADDVGMLVANYRNEPIGLRVFDPDRLGPDGKPGMQAEGLAGDLAYALQTRDDRAIAAFNTKLGDTPYPPLNNGLHDGDPFTPMLRTYSGDLVKIKIQAGSTEHEHNATVHGVKWLQGGSGHGASPNSGWRNAQNDGISEQFTFTAPMTANIGQVRSTPSDYAYSVDSSQDGWWTGMWGIMRSYQDNQGDGVDKTGNVVYEEYLATMSDNSDPKTAAVVNRADFDGACPADAPLREYEVVVLTANQLLGNPNNVTLADSGKIYAGASNQMEGGGYNQIAESFIDPDGGTLVYNNRSGGDLPNGGLSTALHDPTALLYVNLDDLEVKTDPYQGRGCEPKKGNPVLKSSCDVQLKAGVKPEPLMLRAAAGECLTVTLHNRLNDTVPDLAGYNTLLQMVNRDRFAGTGGANGLTTFNNNLIRPSSHVGLHSQLLEYDVSRHDGTNVGLNEVQTVAPIKPDGKLSKSVTYKWYAGHIETKLATTTPGGGPGGKKKGGNGDNDGKQVELVATPVEYGGFNLIPADKIKQGQKGLVGGGSILPVDTTMIAYDGPGEGRTASTITTDSGEVRDAILVFQKGLNHRFSDGSPVPNIASEGQGIPEDSHDAGQMAINYGSEPMWYRFGLKADAPLSNEGPGSFGGVPNPEVAFSNTMTGNVDPVTPVITATKGMDLRIRVLEPTGAGRGTTFNLHGHAWQRDPYLEGPGPDGVPSQTMATGMIGERNPQGFVLGHQESVTPGAHFDIVPLNGAGGAFGVTGDYLYSDQGSFGTTSGLWGILRVQ
jgi:hypothetical protein